MVKWMTAEETAKYLGISKTNLYALVQDGKIPANNVGKKYVFDVDVIDDWIRANKTIETFFSTLNFNIESNLAIREPQRDAYQHAYNYFAKGGKKAIIQMPVGCGKSGLAALLPIGIAKGRVLVITPNLTIRDGMHETFDITNKQRCFWRKMRVLNDNDMLAGPYVCNLEQGNISVCQKSHIIVTNIHQLATNTDKWLNQFDDRFFDMIIVDEGHHSAATSWKKVFEKFADAKIINLTATPFRSDRQELDGELIFRYPFKSACIKGYIKKLTASYVAPCELTFTLKGEEKTYTLEEVLKMRDEEWFSKGVALSEPCNVSIVDNSLEKLEKLRLTGTKHQLIAVACSIRHAEQICALYATRGFSAAVIHSRLEAEKKEEVLRNLRNGILDCIIQVQMLGEGFDHPKLSVAAIFNPFRSLAPYIQFVGRILRVTIQNSPNHPDNYGHIVTHIGMGLDQLLKKFKDFENDDKTFWEEVTQGKEPEPPEDVLNGKTRKKLTNDMIVQNEVIESLFEEDFIQLEERELIEELQEKLKALGLDPSAAEILFKQGNKAGRTRTEPAAPYSVQPQKEWVENRKRLNSEVKRTAMIILNNSGFSTAGMEMPYKLNLGISGKNNLMCAIQLVNIRVNKLCPGKERQEWTSEDYKKAMDRLPEVLNKLVAEIKKAQEAANER